MKRFFSVIAVFFCLFMFAFHVEKSEDIVNAHADFGNVGHGGGGGNGGGHSAHGYGNRSYSGYSDDDDDKAVIFIIGGIMIIGATAAYKYIQWEQKQKTIREKSAKRKISVIRLSFDKSDMERYIEDLFMKLQETWAARDITPVKKYLTEDFFEKNQKILEKEYIKPDLYNVIEDVSISRITLTNGVKKGGKFVFEAHINAQMTDYVVSRNSDIVDEVVVKGSDKVSVNRKYKYTFECADDSSVPENWKLKNITLVK